MYTNFITLIFLALLLSNSGCNKSSQTSSNTCDVNYSIEHISWVQDVETELNQEVEESIESFKISRIYITNTPETGIRYLFVLRGSILGISASYSYHFYDCQGNFIETIRDKNFSEIKQETNLEVINQLK